MSCIVFHRWSAWGNVLPVNTSDGDAVLVQFRWCRKCRKTDLRRDKRNITEKKRPRKRYEELEKEDDRDGRCKCCAMPLTRPALSPFGLGQSPLSQRFPLRSLSQEKTNEPVWIFRRL